MEQTLLLNASYEPLKVVHWQKAITLWCQGKVEIISVYDREIRAVSFSFKLPSVIRLLRYVRIKRRFDYVPFSRANIYARDDYTCQYCGETLPTERADVRSRRAGRAGRPQGLGEHRHLLRLVQPREGRAHAGRGRHAPGPAAEAARVGAGHPHHDRAAQRAGELARLPLLERRARRLVARGRSCPPAMTSTPRLREHRPTTAPTGCTMANPVSHAHLTAVRPALAIEGGRVDVEGRGFAVDGDALPERPDRRRSRATSSSRRPDASARWCRPASQAGRVLVEVADVRRRTGLRSTWPARWPPASTRWTTPSSTATATST